MIVIRGIDKLPPSCNECPLLLWCYEEYSFWEESKNNPDEFDSMTERHELCPLVFLDTTVMPTVKDGVVTNVETRLFDIVEEHHNCFVQILRNSVTGETSFGWRKEEEDEEEEDEEPTVFYATCENCKYFSGDDEFGRCLKRDKIVWSGAACECFKQRLGGKENYND